MDWNPKQKAPPEIQVATAMLSNAVLDLIGEATQIMGADLDLTSQEREVLATSHVLPTIATHILVTAVAVAAYRTPEDERPTMVERFRAMGAYVIDQALELGMDEALQAKIRAGDEQARAVPEAAT